MFQSRLIFHSLAVIKPVVTPTTNGHQMKDLDNIFPLRPYGLTVLQIVWLLQPVKLGHFSKNQKSAKKHNFWQGWNIVFWDTFFQNTVIQRWIKIFSWNQSHMIPNNLNFYVVKAALWYLYSFRSCSKSKFSRFLRDVSPVLPCSTSQPSMFLIIKIKQHMLG